MTSSSKTFKPQTFRAFYKGTSLQAPVYPNKLELFIKTIIEKGEGQILSFMRNGHSISEIKDILTEQMDIMEDGLCRTQDKSLCWKESGSDIQKDWLAKAAAEIKMDGDADFFLALWFMNIAALLKLKVIENDNENGWLMSRIH